MGEVVVGIILPESTGAASTENWDTTRQNYVVSEIQAALNWWDARDLNAAAYVRVRCEIICSDYVRTHHASAVQ